MEKKEISLASGLAQAKGATSNDGLLAIRFQGSLEHHGGRWDMRDLAKVTLRQTPSQRSQESTLPNAFPIAVTKYLT